jgi:phage/plasmid-like protein (TIGR03299 family)
MANLEVVAPSPPPIPWNHVGTKVEGLMTASEVLKEGGLDWKVKKVPVYAAVDGKKVLVPNRFATVRDDGFPLGVVGKSYVPVQNSDALNFMDALTQTGEAIYESTGTFGGGRIVWVTARIPSNGGVDPVDKYLLLTTSHDGSTPVMAAAIALRIWCANQIQAAIRKAKNKFRIRHTTNVEAAIDEARKTLVGSLKYFHEVENVYDRMKEVKFNDVQLAFLVEKVFGGTPATVDGRTDRQINRLESIQEDIHRLSLTGLGTHLPGVRGTAWGAYNAVTEYLDHHTKVKGGKGQSADERLIASSWFGTVAQKTQKAYDTVIEMAKIAA